MRVLLSSSQSTYILTYIENLISFLSHRPDLNLIFRPITLCALFSISSVTFISLLYTYLYSVPMTFSMMRDCLTKVWKRITLIRDAFWDKNKTNVASQLHHGCLWCLSSNTHTTRYEKNVSPFQEPYQYPRPPFVSLVLFQLFNGNGRNKPMRYEGRKHSIQLNTVESRKSSGDSILSAVLCHSPSVEVWLQSCKELCSHKWPNMPSFHQG